MFRNYFKTAWRNLRRNLSYALINLIGLAVGIAACLLIFLVIHFETSFDTFHSRLKNIYRINSLFVSQDGVSYSAGASFATAPALRTDFLQLKNVAGIFKRGDQQLSIESKEGVQKKFQVDVYYAGPEFFQMFDFSWRAGEAKTALSEPATIALTQETAEKFFGDWHNAIGKTIKYNNDDKQVYRVTGILKNIPANSDFPLDVVVSYSTLQNTNIKPQLNDWVSTFGQAYCFVELPKDYSVDKFNKELAAFAKRHKPASNYNDSYVAQPLSNIHYDDRFGNYRNHTFSKSLVTALELIGIFLILVACFNFINLATAQAVNRSREVGVRKVLGGSRVQLAMQFLCETAIITVFSLAVAIAVAYATLPLLNSLLKVHMSMNILGDPFLVLFLCSVGIAVTFLSGFYPAMVLSAFNPINALKSRISPKMTGGLSLRRVLVVLQFTIAHVLIIGTLIVVSQMNYFKNASLGFDKTAIVNVHIPGDSISRTKIPFLRNELNANSNIENISFSYSSPSAEGNWNSTFKFNHEPSIVDFSANLKWADPYYFNIYNLQFIEGGPYKESDTVSGMVVNETFLKKVGINDPKKAIGKQLDFWDGKVAAPIVGVIRDFNSYSLREPVAPVVLGSFSKMYQTINIKIRPGKEKDVLPYVEEIWNDAYPDYVYQYSFLDETIADFYAQENQLSKLYKIFAGIAILISCLGLYGLVSFMAVQRTKEVGIRKVLGATVANIVYLLSREFLLLIIIAFFIAGPIAWYIMHKWLENYAYRIQLGTSIFLLALIGSIVIAWLTVGHRAIKAALSNPVKSLRTE